MNVLIVDDHRRFRASARESEGFDVVGEAADGDNALRWATAAFRR